MIYQGFPLPGHWGSSGVSTYVESAVDNHEKAMSEAVKVSCHCGKAKVDTALFRAFVIRPKLVVGVALWMIWGRRGKRGGYEIFLSAQRAARL